MDLELKEGHWQVEGEAWGLYDTRDNCWLGDEKGPQLYRSGPEPLEAKGLARIAAQILDVRLGVPSGTIQARVYDQTGNRLKDTVDTKMDNVTALKRIEEGLV